jgi:hypothetical protein
MPLAKETFLSLSVRLTGFDRVDLQGTGMLEAYFKYVLHDRQDQPDELERLAAVARELDRLAASRGEVAVQAAIRQHLMEDAAMRPLAANIIRMWYTGSWLADPENPSSIKVISPQAYQEGLVWKVAHSHPPGAKAPGFGTWSELPA